MKSQFLAAVGALFFSATVIAQTPTLQDEPPVVLKSHKLEQFELPPGTVFDLVLEQSDEVMPIAMVSSNVYDFYRNVAIPAGSRLIGRYKGFRSGRHLVDWTELQLPSHAGSLRIDPPLWGTMRDGSTGYVQYKPGASVGATNTQGFIVPH